MTTERRNRTMKSKPKPKPTPRISTVEFDDYDFWRKELTEAIQATGREDLRVIGRSNNDEKVARAAYFNLYTVTRTNPARRVDLTKKELGRVRSRITRKHGSGVSKSVFNTNYAAQNV